MITSPSSGGKATLVKGRPYFAWTLPAGESNYLTLIAGPGSVPNPYDDTAYSAVCSNVPDAPNSSCVDVSPEPAGHYWARVETSDSGGNLIDSNPIPFVMPVILAWGTDPDPAVSDSWIQKGVSPGPPAKAIVEVWGFLNEENAPVTFTFTFRYHGRLVKRIHRTVQTGDGYGAQVAVALRHHHGIPFLSKLKCTIQMSGGGVTLKRTVKMRAA